jgi:hypothetical protein
MWGAAGQRVAHLRRNERPSHLLDFCLCNLWQARRHHQVRVYGVGWSRQDGWMVEHYVCICLREVEACRAASHLCFGYLEGAIIVVSNAVASAVPACH